MTIRELTEKLDVNMPLYIGLVDSEKVVFRRKHASDVIPESLSGTAWRSRAQIL